MPFCHECKAPLPQHWPNCPAEDMGPEDDRIDVPPAEVDTWEPTRWEPCPAEDDPRD